MPAPKTSNPPRGRPPAFKPPRPVKAGAQASASTKRASGQTASRSAGASKKSASSRSAFQDVMAIISSSDEDDHDNASLESDRDELMEDASGEEVRRQSAPPQPSVHPIPAPLLARLLHENFEDGNTQIQKGAMNLVGRYMQIFVQEAVARAQQERETAAKQGVVSDGFLQVEDLEKLAPQLVLDF